LDDRDKKKIKIQKTHNKDHQPNAETVADKPTKIQRRKLKKKEKSQSRVGFCAA